MGVDLQQLRPTYLARLLNATPLGEVINDRQLRRHRTRAGLRDGDEKTVDLFRYAAWLVDVRHSPKESKQPRDYDDVKEQNRKRAAVVAAAGRNIGSIPDIVDVKRRDACRFDLRLFCETYNPDASAANCLLIAGHSVSQK